LRTQVSLLAQAIGTFANAPTAADAGTGSPLTVPQQGNAGPGSSTASLAVVSMVDAMKQFDAHGNALGGAVGVATSTGLQLAPPQDALAAGQLVVAKS
jgi:hypothetical protein